MKKLFLLGSGGHSRSVAEVSTDRYSAGQVKILSLEEFALLPEDSCLESVEFLVALGDVKKRNAYYKLLLQRSWRVTNLVSSKAFLADDVTLGQGSVIMPGAVIRTAAQIYPNTIINTSVIVEHDCVIGESSNLSPGTVVCGSCNIGNQVFVGAGAVLIDGISVCDGAVIGAGAVVIENICLPGLYVGNPARRVK
ncbi:NeuD/PglB/VioB family sugar acetyltransferase [Neptuniibacter sp. QD29_5]|uniref:NeuD/PglB/VioB family sugar acetyltransferase n=1 Tax=Neptuniibacter sp. QD29_5 TaxID=3398207 RepID=UPI0039F46021